MMMISTHYSILSVLTSDILKLMNIWGWSKAMIKADI